MHTSAKLNLYRVIRSIHSFAQKMTFISPYLLGMLLFLIIYVRLCSNDSNIDGDTYFNNAQYAEALESYNEYLMLNPHHIKTLYNRGRCYDELSQYDMAFMDYEAVLSRDPDNVKALVSLSKYYYRTENYEAAVNLSSRAAMVEETFGGLRGQHQR